MLIPACLYSGLLIQSFIAFSVCLSPYTRAKDISVFLDIGGVERAINQHRSVPSISVALIDGQTGKVPFLFILFFIFFVSTSV
jgi:hypothetical protein